MNKYFDDIWDELSSDLLAKDDDYVKYYGLKFILGSHIGGIGRSVGLLFQGNQGDIFNWAKKNKDVAPERLASLIPIFANDNNKYDELHPIAIRLLNEFGDVENVISNFSANMGTYSWTGSIVPLLESKKEVFKFLVNHKLENVRNWAQIRLSYIDKEIENEKNRDQEMYL